MRRSSKKSSSSGSSGSAGSSSDTTKPTLGGSVVYAQEAEDAGGLCLPEAQLDINGINYAQTIYDTLTAPDADGKFVPFLAKSVEHNADGTVWTIVLRDGVKFHDGTAAHRDGREEQPRRLPREVPDAPSDPVRPRVRPLHQGRHR